MIYLLHHSRYMTEYLSFLLKDRDHFSIVRSRCPMTGHEETNFLIPELFEPMKHRVILTSGALMDVTNHNFILARYLHSPGFGLKPLMEAYVRLLKNHATCEYRFICRKEAYVQLIATEALDEAEDRLRYQMMEDPHVVTSEVDHMMCWLQELPRKGERVAGSVLVAPTWQIGREDPAHWEKLLTALSRELRVTVVFHPFTPQPFVEYARAFGGYHAFHWGLSRQALSELYDVHEFIATDGSGSCYEALVRGCKPLLIPGLSYQEKGGVFHSALVDGFLPFPSYEKHGSYGNFPREKWLDEWFPFLKRYTLSQAQELIRQEILGLMDSEG